MYFSHAGDLGDIIYALPTIRVCGGGELWLFNMPGRTTHAMTPERAEKLRRLLEYQDYIHAFGFNQHATDTNINGFRDHGCNNLADLHLATMGHHWYHRNTAWLKVPEPRKTYPVVITRTTRYITPWFDWGAICDKYNGQIGFIGLPGEWQHFCDSYKKSVPFIPADDFMEVAQAIAGCELYIGNPTCATAVAEGLKHPNMILEMPAQQEPYLRFSRKGVVYCVDGKLELPDL